jgi:hypothetical protein
MDIHSPVHIQVAIEEYVFVRQLSIDKQIGKLKGIARIF